MIPLSVQEVQQWCSVWRSLVQSQHVSDVASSESQLVSDVASSEGMSLTPEAGGDIEGKKVKPLCL